MSDLKSRISEATKTAMKAREKARVAALRLVNADIQRVEVDERRTLSDEDIVSILGRMVKQRRDSLVHFEAAAREDLAAQERFEISVIEEFLPEPLSEAEVDAMIERIVAESGAGTMKDMGRVMGVLKGEVAGKADMGLLSGKVKARLS